VAEKDTTTVNVLGKPTSRRQQRNRRLVITAIAVLVLLLVVIAAYRPVSRFIIWNHKTTTQQQAAITQTVFKYQLKNQATQATHYLKNLQHYYTINSQTRYFINLQLAMLEATNNNASGAMKIYQGLIKSHPNDYQLILGLAESADSANNKSLAITYYQKAVDYLNANKPVAYQSDVAGFQARINKLEQGQ